LSTSLIKIKLKHIGAWFIENERLRLHVRILFQFIFNFKQGYNMKNFNWLAIACSLVVSGLPAIAGADPVPLPNPKIPGYIFPQDEPTLMAWVNKPTPANIKNIDLHGWGLWVSLTAPSGQTEFGIPNAPVYLSWLTPEEIIALPPTSVAATAMAMKRQRVLKLTTPKQFLHDPTFSAKIQQRKSALSAAPAGSTTPTQARDTKVAVTVGYDPEAQAFAQKNNLFSKAALTALYNPNGPDAQSIPTFPNTAVTTKPTYKVVSKAHMINGSIYVMPAWPGTPDPSKVDPKVGYGEEQWPGCVYIDTKNTGPSKADGVDANCSGPTPRNTFGLGDFIAYPVTSGNLTSFQDLTDSPTPLVVGDYVILVAMHVTSREITEWTWQSYFWTPNPLKPPLPSSIETVKARPAQLKGPAAHYALSIGYQMVAPNQPVDDGKSVGLPVIAYNPYLEADFGSAVFSAPPTNVGIYNPTTKKTYTGTLGIQTNCMTCHAIASFAVNGSPGLNYATDFYLSRNNPVYKNNLQTDFLWSIPDDAK
jgi:hypothetical protein